MKQSLGEHVAQSALPAAAASGLVVTRMKDNQAALGVALHFLARQKPFASLPAHQLVSTAARQIDAGRYMMAFENGRIVGFLSWELYGTDVAERFARTLVPPAAEAGGGDDVVWLMLAAATTRPALRRMLQAGRMLHPGRRVMGVRHRAGGEAVVLRGRIPPAPAEGGR